MLGKILAIDFGLKRCGIAETDDLQMIASSLATVPPNNLIEFLYDYNKKNNIIKIVFGLPIDLKGNLNIIEKDILKLIEEVKTEFPNLIIDRIDERYTSKMASQAILFSGVNKKKRQDKSLIDKVSATILLQNYLNLSN